MSIPAEVTTALITATVTLIPLGVVALSTWLRVKSLELSSKLRDQKVDEIHKATGAIPGPKDETHPSNTPTKPEI